MALVVMDESLMNLSGISFGRIFFNPYQAKAPRLSIFKKEIVAWESKKPGVEGVLRI
jgi:hypothetical protein